jgi:hypothetical protein
LIRRATPVGTKNQTAECYQKISFPACTAQPTAYRLNTDIGPEVPSAETYWQSP